MKEFRKTAAKLLKKIREYTIIINRLNLNCDHSQNVKMLN